MLDLREARICEKWSAADRISRLAQATSSLRPVTTKTGSSPRTGVLMYVLVFARKALILHPVKRNFISIHSFCTALNIVKSNIKHDLALQTRLKMLFSA